VRPQKSFLSLHIDKTARLPQELEVFLDDEGSRFNGTCNRKRRTFTVGIMITSATQQCS
jgi:hypothetical protein